MMSFPRTFEAKVQQMFGEQGRQWLHELPHLLKASIHKWRLRDWSLSPELSFNLVCFARSPDYGEVALKIGVPHNELYTEMEALALYAGRHICRCYDSDRELGAMLLERLRPGWDLTRVNSQVDRVAVAADLITRLPRPLTGMHNLPSYAEWIERAFDMVRNTPGVDAHFVALVDRAEGYWAELQELDRPEMLLHGDLHHMNILKDGQNGWRAIDPKGVAGMPFLEIPPFVENQLGMVPDNQRREALDQMIEAFAYRTGESRGVIARSLFVVIALRTGWTLEEHHVEPNLAPAIEMLDMIDVLSWESIS